jgi:hypothetical protein
VVVHIMTVMPGMARVCGIVGKGDRCGGRNEPEDAYPQTRGSQGCAKHELPRPNFYLDHRFVRPNYARRPLMFSLFRHTGDTYCRPAGRSVR